MTFTIPLPTLTFMLGVLTGWVNLALLAMALSRKPKS